MIRLLTKNMEFTECFSGHVGVLRVMAPVLATFLFIGFVFISLLISKRHSKLLLESCAVSHVCL